MIEKNWLISNLEQDSKQLLIRFNYMSKTAYSDIQTNRSKLFVDLLMAYECILKAILISFSEESGIEKLHKKIKNYGHDINSMVKKLPKEVPDSLKKRHPLCMMKNKYYKVDLRYSIESYWFLDAISDTECGYYNTVSNLDWMKNFEELINDYIKWFAEHNNPKGKVRFLRSEDIMDNKIEYNPYRARKAHATDSLS